jgi:hypothetical protein
MNKRSLYFALLLVVLTWPVSAQVKTNLQLFEALLDSSVVSMKNSFAYSKIDSVICILPSEAQTLSAYTLSAVKKNTSTSSLEKAEPRIIMYTIEDVQIQYPEIGKYSFFGDNFLVRKAMLKGNMYTGTKIDSIHHFSFASTDTIPLSEKGNVELQNNKFTTAPLPAEPIFSSLLEPVIGVATIAVTTYLLFTVRKTN